MLGWGGAGDRGPLAAACSLPLALCIINTRGVKYRSSSSLPCTMHGPVAQWGRQKTHVWFDNIYYISG